MAVEEPTFGRRQALQSILTGGAAFVAASAANALDMDSFANSQVSKLSLVLLLLLLEPRSHQLERRLHLAVGIRHEKL